MERKNIDKRVIGILVFGIIVFIINVNIASERIKGYKETVLYEDLTFIEKVAAETSGAHFLTKDEAIKGGLILIETKQEARNIVEIFMPISKNMSTDNDKDTDLKINQCKDILDKLHKENDSGQVNNHNLITLIYNCIEATENYKNELESFKKGDLNASNSYMVKAISYSKNVNDDLKRLLMF